MKLQTVLPSHYTIKNLYGIGERFTLLAMVESFSDMFLVYICLVILLVLSLTCQLGTVGASDATGITNTTNTNTNTNPNTNTHTNTNSNSNNNTNTNTKTNTNTSTSTYYNTSAIANTINTFILVWPIDQFTVSTLLQ